MTISPDGLKHALDQLAELRTSEATLDEAMRRVVDSTTVLFGVDGTAFMLLDRDQLLRNVAASDPPARTLEELQIEHGEGPAIDAFDEQLVVGATDLAAERRWPGFAPAAVRRGLVAVLASPIPYSEQAVGVLAVLSSVARPWGDTEREAIAAFTDLAALLVLNAMQARERGRLANELQDALDSRIVIEQAKGVLIGRHGLAPRQAFERLRRQS
ncbi:MAG TPA: GAF and ANTAR domain-containing protein, partial [Actinomycetota bacterium]|nr:GAF and ANTAR domain-containing protein [Actinomycetota bacterium]